MLLWKPMFLRLLVSFIKHLISYLPAVKHHVPDFVIINNHIKQ